MSLVWPGVGELLRRTLLDNTTVQLRKPMSFNWQRTLESEAQDVWDAQIALDAAPWIGRVLLFIELPKHCHSGCVKGIHCSALWNDAAEWANVSGWQGFGARARATTVVAARRAVPAVLPVAHAPVAASVVGTPTGRVADPAPIPAQVLHRLNALLKKQGVHVTDESAWVLLASFLRAVEALYIHI